jgi:hypothetical protein
MPAKVPSRTKPKSGSVPLLWNEWAKNVEIREVAVDAVDFRVDRDRLGAKNMPPVQIRFRLDPKTRTRTGTEAIFRFEFELIMGEQDNATTSAKPLLRALLTYHATYSLPEKPRTTEEHLKRFQERIAVAHVFPFVRAQLADLIMRAGLPPLYLPLAHPGSRSPG